MYSVTFSIGLKDIRCFPETLVGRQMLNTKARYEMTPSQARSAAQFVRLTVQKRAPIPDCKYFKKHPKFRSLIFSANRNTTER